jgi:hypothetical protein
VARAVSEQRTVPHVGGDKSRCPVSIVTDPLDEHRNVRCVTRQSSAAATPLAAHVSRVQTAPATPASELVLDPS